MKKLIVILLLLLPFVALSGPTDGKPEVYKLYQRTFILDSADDAADATDTAFVSTDVFATYADTLRFVLELEGGLYNMTTGLITAQVGSQKTDSVEVIVKLQPTSPNGKTNSAITWDSVGATTSWDTCIYKMTDTASAQKYVSFGRAVSKNVPSDYGKCWIRIVNRHPARVQKYTVTLWAIRKWD